MNAIETTAAIQLLVYFNVIGWGLALIYAPKDVSHPGLKPHMGLLLTNVLVNSFFLSMAMLFIPGITHPVYVIAMSVLVVVNPYFVLSIGEREPIKDTVKGRLYEYLIVSLFTITMLPTLSFLAKDFSYYWPLMILQLGCLASIVVTGAPALIHQQQRFLLRHRKTPGTHHD